MEQYNNDDNNISKNSNFVNENSSKITKAYVIYTILAGILTLTPVSTLVLGSIDSSRNINENIYIISFYIVKIIGFLIYFCVLKEMTKSKRIISILAGISMLMSVYMYIQMNSMESTGIDSIGEALVLSMIFSFFMLVYHILAIVLFILYVKKFILKKEAIITTIMTVFFIILFVVIIRCLAIIKANNKFISKVNDNIIPSVSDLENKFILFTS